ncbi:hypothetical protein TYRP_021960, partial [Tyrophagus putrescentiae]
YYIPEIIAAFGDQLKTLRLDRIPFTELTLEHFQMSFLQLNPPLLNTMNYEAYASKSDQLLVPSQLSNTVSNGLFSKNIEKI